MYLKRLTPLIAALALTVTAGGCATIGTLQTANTLGKGKFQMALEPSAWGAIGSTTVLVPNVTLAARYGLSPTLDIGGRVGSNGFEINGKLQLTPPKAPGLVVSIAPASGASRWPPAAPPPGASMSRSRSSSASTSAAGASSSSAPSSSTGSSSAAAPPAPGAPPPRRAARGTSSPWEPPSASASSSPTASASSRRSPVAYPLVTGISGSANGNSAGSTAVATSNGLLTQISLALLFGG